MKTFLIILSIFICTQIFASERILDFHARVNVLNNGDIHVIETIKVNVENKNIRHGIYRDTPTIYFGMFYSHNKFDVTIINVTLDGIESPYHQERLINGLRVKIGSGSYYVNKGIHVYSIEYITQGQVKDLKLSNGLYWNVTGNGWNFSIDKASADIYFPTFNNIKILTQDAWTGFQGSTNQNYTSQLFDDHIHFETTKKLDKNQGFTVQTTWPLGLITEPKNKLWVFIKNNVYWLASIAMLILYTWYFYSVWKKVGVDPPKRVIYPQYKPPKNISPAAIKFILDKYYDSKSFSVAIMNLAVKGYISIEQTSKNEYILKNLKPQGKIALSSGEKVIYKHLFRYHKSIIISNTYDSKIKTASNLLDNSLTNEHKDACYKNNNNLWFFGVIISLIATLVTWGHFFNFSGFAVPYLVTSTAMIAISAVVIVLVKKPIQKYLSVIAISTFLIFTLMSHIDSYYFAYIFISLFMIIFNAMFYFLIQAPTLFGRKLLDQIEGFKLYLATAEQDRLDLMHPPEITPQLFEKYLPYALALGVENRWSKQFHKAMRIHGDEYKNYQPSWYIGHNYSNYDFASTATAIGAGLASSVVAASTPPSSNSSGGFGGGFSGGGGGGGGGGGW